MATKVTVPVLVIGLALGLASEVAVAPLAAAWTTWEKLLNVDVEKFASPA